VAVALGFNVTVHQVARVVVVAEITNKPLHTLAVQPQQGRALLEVTLPQLHILQLAVAVQVRLVEIIQVVQVALVAQEQRLPLVAHL
jgi:hypothetical protein